MTRTRTRIRMRIPTRSAARFFAASFSPLLGLALVAILAFGPACGKKEGAQSGAGGSGGEGGGAGANVKVGLVFDVGGRGDKSFNDAAYAGLERAQKDLGVPASNIEYIEPGEGGDRESALRQLAAGAYDVIFGVGFLFSDDILAVAKDFPEKKFACIDMNVPADGVLPANVVALKFKEEEGSYLVGALSGWLTKTNKVGFVGGMQIPLIKKFEAGYVAGVAKANPRCAVDVKYAGVDGNAFKNPTKGKELALAIYGGGADIIYHASGSTGLGVFEAANEKNKLAIGVDSDQWDSMPGRVLTSMVKRVDVAVFNTIKDQIEGRFPGGQTHVFGLKEGGVDYVYDDRNKSLIPDDVHQKVEALREQIVSGAITAPAQ
ncbi:MAG: BMP family lipoprotein [Candidatus Eiseniibacteriota bacterium]